MGETDRRSHAKVAGCVGTFQFGGYLVELIGIECDLCIKDAISIISEMDGRVVQQLQT